MSDTRDIWIATYAAHFAAEFAAAREEGGFDEATQMNTVQEAFVVADIAVAEFERFRDKLKNDEALNEGWPDEVSSQVFRRIELGVHKVTVAFFHDGEVEE